MVSCTFGINGFHAEKSGVSYWFSYQRITQIELRSGSIHIHEGPNVRYISTQSDDVALAKIYAEITTRMNAYWKIEK